MWAAGSIEDWANQYRADGRIVHGGLWSILISQSAQQSADFADRYMNVFNSVVGQGWHLAVYSSPNDTHRGMRWRANEKLHRHVINARFAIEENGSPVPDLCAVFFDPNVGVSDKRAVIVTFDAVRIADEQLYREKFKVTHECIMRSFDELKLDVYQTPPADKINDILDRLDHELSAKKIVSRVTGVVDRLANAALGAIVAAV